MKLLLITDQHFGVRNDNLSFVEKYKQFYNSVVIPFITAYNIKHVISLGDTFDKRKSINFNSLDAAKDMWFTPLSELGVQLHMLVGNHDIYFKNTLRINAPRQLLGEYSNITVYDSPTTVKFDNTDLLLLPWICDDNRDVAFREIANSPADVCLGHLEFNGFESVPGFAMTGALDPSIMSRFKKVLSGHFHHRSSKGNITYLGNPYQLYWNDYGCKRGFHVLDTDDLSLTFYRNPFPTFHKIFYNDMTELPDEKELENCWVKIVVEDKKDYARFDSFIRTIQEYPLADLKIIEDMQSEIECDEVMETEDTLTMLESYIDEGEFKVNKDNIKTLIKTLYLEACTYS